MLEERTITDFDLCVPSTTIMWTDEALMSLLLACLKPIAEKCGYTVVVAKDRHESVEANG